LEEKENIKLELSREEKYREGSKKDNLLILRDSREVIFLNFKTGIRAKIESLKFCLGKN